MADKRSSIRAVPVLAVQAKFQRLVRSNVVGIISSVPERIENANDAFLEMIGYSRDELERGEISWRALTPPEYAALDDKGLAELRDQGESRPYAKEYIRKDGHRVPVLIGGVRISEAPLEWINFVVDRTSQRTAELQLEREVATARAALQRADRLATLLTVCFEPIFAWKSDGAIEFWNQGAERLYGFAAGEAIGQLSHSLLQTCFSVPQAALRAHLAEHRNWTGELRHTCKDGREVIVESRLQLLDDGTVVEADRDVTDEKSLADRQSFLLRELDHRVCNSFAIASSLVHLTAKSSASVREMEGALASRVDTMARAHDLIRTSGAASGSTLADVLELTVLPHAAETKRVCISGPEVELGSKHILNLALVFQELATNALKHGALSRRNGRLRIEWRLDGGQMLLTWSEQGMEVPAKMPQREGFGTRLAETCIRQQLGGRYEREWTPDGVTISLRLPVAHLRE